MNFIWNHFWRKNFSVWQSFAGEEGIEEFAELWSFLSNKRIVLQSRAEAWFLYSLCKRLSKVDGHIAEVGVFEGFTARVLAEAKGSKQLHLFDTFDGFPYGKAWNKKFDNGKMAAPESKAKELLKPFKEVFFYKGVFPETGEKIKGVKFCLVHIDSDVGIVTRQSLEFFYSRLSLGGFFVVHDYKFFEEVRKAVDGFFSNKPEVVLKLFDTQAVIQKL